MVLRRPYRTAKFESRLYRKRLHKMVVSSRFDLIWVHFPEMLRFLRDPRLSQRIRTTPVVLDQHNDMERYWSSFDNTGGLLESAWARWNIRRIRSYRERTLSLCDVVLSVSRKDAQTTREVAPENTPVLVTPNGVDTEYFKYVEPSEGTPRHILFVGSMDVRMNVDAATWFAEEVFPILRDRIPDTRFLIVGRNPTARVESLSEIEGVCVTGRVDDLRGYYRQAAVAVIPTRQGGGTKLKVLEAMAAGTPVVSTAHGVSGYEIADGIHVKIADDSMSFAEAVATLLTNKSEARRLARAAREKVCERYTWTTIYGTALDQIDSRLSRA